MIRVRSSLLLRLLGGLAVAALLVAGCSDDDDGESAEGDRATTTVADGTATTEPAVPLPEPVLEPRECDPDALVDVAEGVTPECHWLVVPANRDAFDGETLKLAVTVLPSTSDEPLPDPVVYLSGGPGYPGGSARYWSSTPFIDERDVIVWDQRGTGISEPTLECPEMEASVLRAFGAAAPFEEEQADVLEAIGACRERLEGEGIDLTGFSTPASAADLEDLRVALGYDEWNLLGVSYGSRLAQEAMRSYPDGIRSVILDSTYPTSEGSATELVAGAQRSFDTLAAGCAADEACAAAHGDLTAALDEIVATYNADPYESTVDLGEEFGGEVDIVITGDDIVAGLFTALYDTTLIPALSAFASALNSGEAGLIDQVAAQGIPFINSVSEGMALSTNCADAVPVAEAAAETDAELLADPGKWASMLTAFSPAFCAQWTAGAVDDGFAEPVTAEHPTLVLSGLYDPITSTPDAETVAAALPNATFVTFDGVGHGVWDTSECATGMTLAFLADPTAEVDTACAAEVPPPDFA